MITTNGPTGFLSRGCSDVDHATRFGRIGSYDPKSDRRAGPHQNAHSATAIQIIAPIGIAPTGKNPIAGNSQKQEVRRSLEMSFIVNHPYGLFVHEHGRSRNLTARKGSHRLVAITGQANLRSCRAHDGRDQDLTLPPTDRHVGSVRS